MSAYFLVRWGKTLKFLEAKYLKTPMLSLDGTNMAKREEEISYRQSITTIDSAPKGLEETSERDNIK